MLSNNRPSVTVGEWLVVVSFLFLLTLLTLASHQNYFAKEIKVSTSNTFHLFSQKIHVKILGAVQHPGVYELEKEATYKDVIEKAGGFTEKANKDNFIYERKIKSGQVINVTEKVFITVHISGSVIIPGAVMIEKGATIEDLLEKIKLLENADTSSLKSSRKLKNGQKVFIPSKKYAL